ncbi:type II toxin-antitoxin system RelE/ParE family toxin [Maribellus luteus]|uniref:Type II toxin-antitoxin system RelE/ParE family toxin n=1 Tax=Maribellus luteus TaxID=2305463 RepID=A0A399T5N0_9BACT|nr:type II toxin-antitoxin system RelE/ParE family toxin [Maribellus luteus]RIJ50439.1 type II toxin-antitoxin system RelE/ParE family toxin [Maribellus luteus]
MVYKLIWTKEAVDNLEKILSYLEEKWTERETQQFKKRLSKQLELILQFPEMFPVSTYNPKLRKAVLSKQTTLFYKLDGERLYLVSIFVNLQDIGKIEKL